MTVDNEFEATEPIVGHSYKSGEDYYPPGVWEARIDSKLKTLTLEVHVTAIGTIVLVLGAALMGRSIVQLFKAQGQVFSILANAGIIPSQPDVPNAKQETQAAPSEQGSGQSSGVSYSQPSGFVDTSSAGPVDPELLDELKTHVDQDPLRGGGEGPIG